MNKAILMGRLTKDPELRTTSNNTSVTSFTVAVDRRFKNARGEREADFINCVAWRQTAEFVTRYFRKGSRIALVGTIQTRYWDDADGKRNFMTEVVTDEVYFAENKRDDQDSYRQNRSDDNHPSYENSQNDIPAGDGFLPVDSDDTSLPFDL